MQLFFIAYSDDDGNTLDQFVAAADAQRACELWRANYELDDEEPDGCWIVPPAPSSEGVLDWFTGVVLA